LKPHHSFVYTLYMSRCQGISQLHGKKSKKKFSEANKFKLFEYYVGFIIIIIIKYMVF